MVVTVVVLVEIFLGKIVNINVCSFINCIFKDFFLFLENHLSGTYDEPSELVDIE